jgi:hypothetical protein
MTIRLRSSTGLIDERLEPSPVSQPVSGPSRDEGENEDVAEGRKFVRFPQHNVDLADKPYLDVQMVLRQDGSECCEGAVNTFEGSRYET